MCSSDLRTHRHRLGLTQLEVARRIGIDRSDLSRLERGAYTRITLSVGLRLHSLYGIPLDQLATLERVDGCAA